MAEKKKDVFDEAIENNKALAIPTQSFNLSIGGDAFAVSPELMAEVGAEDFAGYDASRAALPIVSIRQKDLKDTKGAMVAPAGGYRIYDPVTAASGITIPDQTELTVTFLTEQGSRTLWKQGNMGDPDCKAPDGIFGIGDPGGECAKCPMSQWIDNKRPQCNSDANVLTYDHGSGVCYVVRFGRSGLKPWNFFKELVKRLASGQMPIHGMVVKMTTQYNAEPAPHYIPVITIVGQVGIEKFRLFKQFRVEWLDVLKRTASVEVAEHETTAEVVDSAKINLTSDEKKFI